MRSAWLVKLGCLDMGTKYDVVPGSGQQDDVVRVVPHPLWRDTTPLMQELRQFVLGMRK